MSGANERWTPPAEPTRTDCSGVILAGGWASRFAGRKADHRWRGQSMLSHVAERLCQVCGEIIAVAREEQPTADWPVDRVVFDNPAFSEGPLRGIVAGLSACRTPWALIAPCDAPLLDSGLCRMLRRHADPSYLAVVPCWNGHVQPLVALYAAEARGPLLACLVHGERSPRRALRTLVHHVVAEHMCGEVDPTGGSFLNVNAPEDLAAYDRDHHLSREM